MNLSSYIELKKQVDAAYAVLKKTPSSENVTRYSNLQLKLQELCVQIVEEEVSKVVTEKDTHKEILENIEEYKTCKECGSEILYQINEGNFIASSDFVEDFPGWCYNCLLQHCIATNCEACTVTTSSKCSFKEIKKLNM
jgi:hypothetical protein